MRRPYIGTASRITSRVSPSASRARRPRADIARLMERDAEDRGDAGASRASMIVTEKPERASEAPSVSPARPAPTITTSRMAATLFPAGREERNVDDLAAPGAHLVNDEPVARARRRDGEAM